MISAKGAMSVPPTLMLRNPQIKLGEACQRFRCLDRTSLSNDAVPQEQRGVLHCTLTGQRIRVQELGNRRDELGGRKWFG
jgi:hypothetical protein